MNNEQITTTDAGQTEIAVTVPSPQEELSKSLEQVNSQIEAANLAFIEARATLIELQAEQKKLAKALAALSPKQPRVFSPEARQRISESQKARWIKYREAKEGVAAQTTDTPTE